MMPAMPGVHWTERACAGWCLLSVASFRERAPLTTTVLILPVLAVGDPVATSCQFNTLER